jgi:hypothetical protein
MNDSDEKFALEYYTADDADPQGPPFKYRSHYLDDAVAEAWRLRDAGNRPLRVTRGSAVTLDEGALESTLARVSELSKGEPEQPLREIAARALGENVKAHGA